MRDRIVAVASGALGLYLAIALLGASAERDRLQRRNDELSDSLAVHRAIVPTELIRRAAAQADSLSALRRDLRIYLFTIGQLQTRLQMREGQLSWCLNTPLVGFHPTVEQVSQ